MKLNLSSSFANTKASGKKVSEIRLTPSITVDPSLLEDEDWKSCTINTNTTYEILNKFKNDLMKKMAARTITLDEYNYLNITILPAAIYVSDGSEVSKMTIKKFFLDLDLDEEIDKIKSEKYLQMVKSKMGKKYHDDFINIVIPAVTDIIPE